MFPVTITLHNIADLDKVLNALSPRTLGAGLPPAAPAEAPGKLSAAPTARSPRTAEAAPAPEAAAPAPKAETPAAPSTEPSAAAPSAPSPAPADAKPFEYATLQKAVNSRIATVGKAKLLEIATKHGASTFKDLPADKWEAAFNDVIALGV